MRRGRHQKGVTLIELVVASSLIGILFFSGLQLLASVMKAQAAMTSAKMEVSLDEIALEARLRSLLSGSHELVISKNMHQLDFMQGEAPEHLIFTHLADCKDNLALVQDERTLTAWKLAKAPYGFELRDNQLLVRLPGHALPITIWLRNGP